MNDYKERALVLIDILQTRHVLTMREKGLLRRAILENEPKRGKWGKWVISEIQCPNCFEHFQTDCFSMEELNKCPICAADMREADDDT